MMNLGNVVADSTIRIPFNSFDADGASTTISNFIADDIKIYKDGTERGNSAGYSISADVVGDGLQVAIIDLSDNTVANFYEVGSTYDVAINSVTIDGETVRFWVGRFSIENTKVGDKIKSVQHMLMTLNNGENNRIFPINPVDWAKTEMQFRGSRVNAAASADGLASCLASPTDIGAGILVVRERSVGTCTIGVDVVEWE